MHRIAICANCIGYHGKVEHIAGKQKYSLTSSFLFHIDTDTNELVFMDVDKIKSYIGYHGKVGHFAYKLTFSWTNDSCFTSMQTHLNCIRSLS